MTGFTPFLSFLVLCSAETAPASKKAAAAKEAAGEITLLDSDQTSTNPLHICAAVATVIAVPVIHVSGLMYAYSLGKKKEGCAPYSRAACEAAALRAGLELGDPKNNFVEYTGQGCYTIAAPAIDVDAKYFGYAYYGGKFGFSGNLSEDGSNKVELKRYEVEVPGGHDCTAAANPVEIGRSEYDDQTIPEVPGVAFCLVPHFAKFHRCDCRLNPIATDVCCPWIDCTENAKDIQDEEFPDCLSRHKHYGASDDFIKGAKCETYANEFCYRRWGDKRDSKDAMMNCCTKTCNKHNKHIVGPRAVGEACSTNDGCTSGSCDGEQCQAVALGEACTAPTDCTTGRCEGETDSTKTCKDCKDKKLTDVKCFEKHSGADEIFRQVYTSCAVFKKEGWCLTRDIGYQASKSAMEDCCAATCDSCASPGIVTSLDAECGGEKLCQKPMTCKDGKCQQVCKDWQVTDKECLKRHVVFGADAFLKTAERSCEEVKEQKKCFPQTFWRKKTDSRRAVKDCCAKTCDHCSA